MDCVDGGRGLWVRPLGIGFPFRDTAGRLEDRPATAPGLGGCRIVSSELPEAPGEHGSRTVCGYHRIRLHRGLLRGASPNGR